MARMSYKTVLKAKGVKPLRHPAHTVKKHGDLELLPVEGVHRHCRFLTVDDIPDGSIVPISTLGVSPLRVS